MFSRRGAIRPSRHDACLRGSTDPQSCTSIRRAERGITRSWRLRSSVAEVRFSLPLARLRIVSPGPRREARSSLVRRGHARRTRRPCPPRDTPAARLPQLLSTSDYELLRCAIDNEATNQSRQASLLPASKSRRPPIVGAVRGAIPSRWRSRPELSALSRKHVIELFCRNSLAPRALAPRAQVVVSFDRSALGWKAGADKLLYGKTLPRTDASDTLRVAEPRSCARLPSVPRRSSTTPYSVSKVCHGRQRQWEAAG